MPSLIADEPEPIRAQIREPRPGTRAGWLGACVLITLGLGLHWILRANTDLPPLGELIREGRDLILPAAQHPGAMSRLLRSDSAPGGKLWTLAWVAGNGQWDGRLLAIAGLPLQLMGLALLLAPLARGRRTSAGVAIGGGALAILLWSPVAPRPAESAAGPSLLLILSLLHLAGMTRSPPGKGRWWAGWVCGGLNLLAANSGIASAMALTLWGLLSPHRGPPESRARRPTVLANGLLVVVGMALALVRRDAPERASSWLQAVGANAAWPFLPMGWAAVVWAPALVFLVRWVRARSVPPALAPVALWAVMQVFAGFPLSYPGELRLAGVVINAACLVSCLWPVWGWPVIRGAVLGLWLIAVGNGLLFPAPAEIPQFCGPDAEASVTAVLRRASFTGETQAMRSAAGLTGAETDEWQRLLRDPDFRRLLPGSIRLPLAVAPAPGQERSVFSAAGVPALPGRDDLPALGTWSREGGATAGEFVSAPLETSAGMLQIRVAGELQGPATGLVLRTAQGRDIGPLESPGPAKERWRRVNFPAPTGPFQIVAQAAVPGRWLAFTEPEELARGSWIAGKLAASWLAWLAGGLILGGGLGVAAFARWTPAPADESAARCRRLAPWLALLAYAVFFSHHIDATAGPNDSGGYLNSAKILLSGHLTGAPRLLFGPAAGTMDISPYVPITFHANGAGRLVPEYPVGVPLEIWAVAQFTSLARAVPVLILLQLVLGVVATRGLARALGLPHGWAWLGAAIVGLSPLYLFLALQPLSDGPALVWVTAAVTWAWMSRTRPWFALWAGLATGMAVLIRPSDLLVVIPILICLAGSWRQLAGWVLGCLPGALWLLWYHHQLYGSSFVTGYGEVGDLFAAHFVLPTLRSYLHWLPELLTPVILFAAAGPWLRSIPLRARLVLTSWVAAFALFYACYWCTFDPWFNMRFVLPAAPPLVLLGLMGLRRLSEWAGWALFDSSPTRRSLLSSSAVTGLLLGFLLFDGRRGPRQVLYWMHSNRQHAIAAEWAQAHLPANAVVFAKHATGSLTYYTPLLFVRSDLPPDQTPEFLAALARTGRPVFALLYHWEGRGYDPMGHPGDGRPDLPGDWERVAALWDNEVYVWAWHPPAPARP